MMRQQSMMKYVIIAACFLFWGSKWYESTSTNLMQRYQTVMLAWVQLEAAYRDHVNFARSLSATAEKLEPNRAGAANVLVASEDHLKRLRDPSGLHKITDLKELGKYSKSFHETAEASAALITMSEESPLLKNDRNFKDLVTRLKKTEADVVTKEARFDEAARDYNRAIERFPSSLVAKRMKMIPHATLK